MANISSPLYITYVEKEGAFLKIWGQTDRNIPVAIEKSLSQLRSQFDEGVYIPPYETLQVGQLLCSKYKDGLYYRAKVTSTALAHQGVIEVQFLDYGNRDYVPYLNTRTMTSNILSIPPQAREFILAQVTLSHPAMNEEVMLLISNEIRYLEMNWTQVGQVGPYMLIQLSTTSGQDLAINLVTRHILLSIPLTTQQIMLQSYISGASIPVQMATPPLPSPPIKIIAHTPPPMAVLRSTPPPTQTLLTYKSSVLEPGSQYAVYVSYVTDGPLQFSVQLQKLEDALAKLMGELNQMPLQPVEENLLPGMVCVARCLEDGYICRAVVTSVVDGQFKVFYVDFGNIEVVPLENLYQIPFKYVIPKVMAMRFCLAGLEKSNVTLEMKCAFKEYVGNKKLTMLVLPSARRTAIQFCELYDGNTNILDILKSVAMQSYAEPVTPNRGLSQDIHISYVCSCSKFYVQLKSKEDELKVLMAELQTTYPKEAPVSAAAMKLLYPVCALYEADGQWYRAQVIELAKGLVKVRYVDYGNEDTVALINVRKPLPEHITVLRPQAIECCLNGYQNMGVDQERDNLLEELILEQDFSMKVVDIQENRLLVELFDSDRYNVSSLLLEKIANARAQVSPLLIQDGHKIEHRKVRSVQSGEWTDSQEGAQRRDRRIDFSEIRQGRFEHERTKREFRERRGDSGEGSESKFRGGGKGSYRNDHVQEGFGEDNGFDKPERRGGGRFPDKRQDFNKFRDRNEGDRPQFRNRNADRGPQEGEWDSGDKSHELKRNDRWDTNKSSPQEGDNWGSGPRNRDFKRSKSDHNKSGSEKSWSDGSDTNWRKGGPRTSSRNDNKPKFGQKPDSNRRVELSKKSATWNGSSEETSWNVSSVGELPDLAPSDAKFAIIQVTGQTKNVTISWFHNPSHFYCQLEETMQDFKTMMEDIQTTYGNRKPVRASVGAPVVGMYEDKVLYRAEVLDSAAGRYRVRFVDFGNVSEVDAVFAIDRKFMELPAQAVRCKLKDVCPVEHEWASADTYGPFFNKEKFACSFVSLDMDCYAVVLLIDGTTLSVGEALVSAGFAGYANIGGAQIEYALLVGQQIRAVLSDVTSLADFKLFVPPDLSLLCCAHNLESATQSFEEALKAHVGNNVIVYVDNVVDDRIEVTVYDTQGFKIQIVEPDEGAYDSVEPLCAFPVFYYTLYGWVSHITPTTVFLQASGFEETLAQMLDQLFQHYDSTILETPLVPVIDGMYVVRSSDGNWYRAKVTAVEDEGVNVTYVDYGNAETVAFTEVREIEPHFMEVHVLGMEILVSEPTEELLDKQAVFYIVYTENGWEGAIIHDTNVISSSTSGIVSGESSVPAESIEQATVVPEEEPATVMSEEEPATVVPAIVDRINVIASHIDTPNEFYLQLSDATHLVAKLQEDLQTVAPALPDLENPSAGVLCAAQYSLDQQWYRAQVLDADVDITTIRFVDYGNTDVLGSSSPKVKTLPPDLLTLEQHARRCSLNVRPVDEEWSQTALERFEALVDASDLTARIVSLDEKATYVDLHANNENIADALIREQLAQKIELTEDTPTTGFVSHLNSPSEFWIQFESACADLEWISDELTNAESFAELEDFTPGSLCAAVFPEDDHWYRARILSNTVAGLEVLFIDYGNSCTCRTVRALPEDVVMVPPMALKSCLQKPSGVEQWSAVAAEKFREISADGATVFVVRKLSTGETSVVELTLEGEDVGLMLLPKTLDCRVTRFVSLDEFYITKDGDAQQLDTRFKLEVLPGMQWVVEASTKFVELNKEGQTLFKVEFVTGDTVRLYTNYDDIRPQLGCEKETTPSSSVTPKKFVDLSQKPETEILVEDISVSVTIQAAEQSETDVVVDESSELPEDTMVAGDIPNEDVSKEAYIEKEVVLDPPAKAPETVEKVSTEDGDVEKDVVVGPSAKVTETIEELSTEVGAVKEEVVVGPSAEVTETVEGVSAEDGDIKKEVVDLAAKVTETIEEVSTDNGGVKSEVVVDPSAEASETIEEVSAEDGDLENEVVVDPSAEASETIEEVSAEDGDLENEVVVGPSAKTPETVEEVSAEDRSNENGPQEVASDVVNKLVENVAVHFKPSTDQQPEIVEVYGELGTLVFQRAIPEDVCQLDISEISFEDELEPIWLKQELSDIEEEEKESEINPDEEESVHSEPVHDYPTEEVESTTTTKQDGHTNAPELETRRSIGVFGDKCKFLIEKIPVEKQGTILARNLAEEFGTQEEQVFEISDDQLEFAAHVPEDDSVVEVIDLTEQEVSADFDRGLSGTDVETCSSSLDDVYTEIVEPSFAHHTWSTIEDTSTALVIDLSEETLYEDIGESNTEETPIVDKEESSLVPETLKEQPPQEESQIVDDSTLKFPGSDSKDCSSEDVERFVSFEEELELKSEEGESTCVLTGEDTLKSAIESSPKAKTKRVSVKDADNESEEGMVECRTTASSRSSSRGSGRLNYDDRLIPAAISRPRTPEVLEE